MTTDYIIELSFYWNTDTPFRCLQRRSVLALLRLWCEGLKDKEGRRMREFDSGEVWNRHETLPLVDFNLNDK